jgi:hypothetical protein
MSLRNILVHVTDTAQSKLRLETAVALCVAHDAHLTGLAELVEGKIDLLIARGVGRHPGYRCDRLDEGPGTGEFLIAPDGSADCPEIVSFRDWLRVLPG